MKTATDIEREAAAWLIRRDRGESSGDAANFESWLAADSRHRAAYRNLELMWRKSQGLEAWRPADGSLDTAVLKSSGSRGATFGRWQFAIAASVTLLVAVGIAWLGTGVVGASTYATQVGGYQRVLLRDGSVIQLNTDTRVRVRLGSERREVRLVRGEAFFEIAHDPQRPFEVIAGDTIVRAVGTAFTVRLREQGAVEVVVTEGSVTLRTDELPAEETRRAPKALPALAAGEAAVAGSTGVSVQRIAEPEVARRLAWQDGEIEFDGDPLIEVASQFNRYNHRRLEIDPGIAALKVGGNFRATDLDGFLRAMRSSFDVYAHESDGVVRLSRSAPDAPRAADE